MGFYFQVFFEKLIEYHQRKICTYGNDIFLMTFTGTYRRLTQFKIMNALQKITAFVVTFILRKSKLFFVDYLKH